MEKKELLEAMNFPVERITRVAELASTLSKLMAEAGSDRLEDAEERIIRDKAIAYLIQAVRKVRKCGKFVNRDDDSRLKGYISHYTRRANKKSRETQPEPAPAQ